MAYGSTGRSTVVRSGASCGQDENEIVQFGRVTGNTLTVTLDVWPNEGNTAAAKYLKSQSVQTLFVLLVT